MVTSTGVVGLESPLIANLRALLVMLRVNGHWGRLVASPGAWVGVSRGWPVGLGGRGWEEFLLGRGMFSRWGGEGGAGHTLGEEKIAKEKNAKLKLRCLATHWPTYVYDIYK